MTLIKPHTVCVNEVAIHVGLYYDVKIWDLLGTSKPKRIAAARFIAIYLARQLTNRTFEEIGRYFHRDHSTMMNACARVGERAKTDNELAAQLRILADQILDRGDDDGPVGHA